MSGPSQSQQGQFPGGIAFDPMTGLPIDPVTGQLLRYWG